MSKRKAIRKLLRLKILWAGLFVASVIVAFWYAPKLNEPITSDPVKIGFIGDSITRGVKNIRYFQQHRSLLLDGVHPNAEGNQQLGRLWANAYEKIMSEQLANKFAPLVELAAI
jgi:hypothetical protein